MHAPNFPIRISSVKAEGLLQASKWLKTQVLLDKEEMSALLAAMAPLHCVVVSEPVEPQDALLSPQVFLEKYTHYIDALRRGEIPPNETFRRCFSLALSTTLDTFYAIPASGNKYLIKPLKPVIQLQAHHFFYSTLDRKFHPMALSAQSISWGLQFSYPQLFQDPKTHQIMKVGKTSDFPNSALFLTLMRHLRNVSLPTPFHVDAARTNSPIRIGKQCLPWIKSHPQLQMNGIQVFS